MGECSLCEIRSIATSTCVESSLVLVQLAVQLQCQTSLRLSIGTVHLVNVLMQDDGYNTPAKSTALLLRGPRHGWNKYPNR